MKKIFQSLAFVLVVVGGAFLAYQKNEYVRETVSRFLHLSEVAADTVKDYSSEIPVGKENERLNGKTGKERPPGIYDALDKYARETPKSFESNIEKLAAYLIKPARTDMEKVRCIFTWMATHVTYDVDAYSSGSYQNKNYDAETVLRKKTAVCEGYANLMKSICDAAGLEAVSITGYAKGYGYKEGQRFKDTNHAWNAVKIDGRWKLFDPTWGAGYVEKKGDKLVAVKKFNPFWYDVHPKAFVFSHLPSDDKFQLIEDPISLEQFVKLPYVMEYFFVFGFDPEISFEKALSREIRKFPETYAFEDSVYVIEMPYNGTIESGNEYDFKLICPYVESIQLIQDNKWIPFNEDDGFFYLKHIADGKEISISIKVNETDRNYHKILKYRVSAIHM